MWITSHVSDKLSYKDNATDSFVENIQLIKLFIYILFSWSANAWTTTAWLMVKCPSKFHLNKNTKRILWLESHIWFESKIDKFNLIRLKNKILSYGMNLTIKIMVRAHYIIHWNKSSSLTPWWNIAPRNPSAPKIIILKRTTSICWARVSGLENYRPSTRNSCT